MKDNFSQQLRKAASLIKKSRSIIIACHINPDADAIGSMLALGIGLKRLKKRVFLISNDEVPVRYRDLPQVETIKKSHHKPEDLAISVDCADIRQLGPAKNILMKCRDVLEIDHHLYRKPFGNLQLVKEEMASVGELVFLILKELKVTVDEQIAENILTAIIVETLSFQLNKVNRLTFGICEKLLARKIDFYKISQRHYWAESLNSLRLSGLCFYRMKTLNKGSLAWSIIFKRDFKKFGASYEDVDSVADKMLAIKPVKVALLFRQAENGMRVSLRSKNNINVGKFAFDHDGGGHFDVASCLIPNTKASVRQFLKEVGKLL